MPAVRGPGPGRPCRTLEDPGLGRLRDADPVVLDGERPRRRTHERSPGPRRRPPSRTDRSTSSAVRRLNFTALWTRLTRTWPSRSSSPRTGGTCGATSTTSRSPCRSANSRSRSAAVRRDPAEVDVVEQDERPAALDPGEVEQLVDHLDEVAGLDLDLADPVAHPRRDRVAGGLGVAGERLGQQADGRERRPQLVRQVVDELGPDLLEPAQLGDVLEDDPDAVERRAPRPDDEDRAVRRR